MKVIKMEEANLKEPLSLAIGFFDGLHLGHMSLIIEVLKYKGETKTAVMSFDVHPLCVLKGEKRQSIITLEEKKELLEEMGIDYLLVIHFTKEVAALSPQAFIDEYLNNVFIKGEISNFKHHYTGHMYFTLKDDKSLIKCIMFKSYTANLNFVPKDGLKVMILGTVSVFERDGVYQIYCKAMQEDGLGSLHVAYEELKKKLEHEGLFDVAHKKPIPKMPKCIGVLTSNTGSVIRDIINVSTRRNPNVYIKLLPVPVQGEGAAVKIAKAIKIMNEQIKTIYSLITKKKGNLLWQNGFVQFVDTFMRERIHRQSVRYATLAQINSRRLREI